MFGHALNTATDKNLLSAVDGILPGEIEPIAEMRLIHSIIWF